MKLIICVDEKNGMAFFNRRQSRDKCLCKKIIELTKGSKLFMSEYSLKLFDTEDIKVCNDFLDIPEPNAFCFWEKEIKSLDNIEELYVFNWNRRYPADVFFDFDLEKEGFVLDKTEEFAGNSHEKITLKVYKRNQEVL